MHLTFVEETLRPIRSPASASRSPCSFLPLGGVPGARQCLGLPFLELRDSLGSKQERGRVYSYSAVAPLLRASLGLKRPLAVLGAGPRLLRTAPGFGFGSWNELDSACQAVKL